MQVSKRVFLQTGKQYAVTHPQLFGKRLVFRKIPVPDNHKLCIGQFFSDDGVRLYLMPKPLHIIGSAHGRNDAASAFKKRFVPLLYIRLAQISYFFRIAGIVKTLRLACGKQAPYVVRHNLRTANYLIRAPAQKFHSSFVLQRAVPPDANPDFVFYPRQHIDKVCRRAKAVSNLNLMLPLYFFNCRYSAKHIPNLPENALPAAQI